MTTKRKQILKAIAVSGSATIEDLVMTTGLERKNLHDNVKATLKGELCLRIKDDVATGYPLNVAMKQVGVFPHMVMQMTAIGEEAGALDTMLYKVAEFYEQEVNNAVDALSSLIEPMVMIVIGGVVGYVAGGLF